VYAADDAEDPAAAPVYWISKWVDYTDKYGIGYQLCDNSVGVLFNDSTRLLLASNAEYVRFIRTTQPPTLGGTKNEYRGRCGVVTLCGWGVEAGMVHYILRES